MTRSKRRATRALLFTALLVILLPTAAHASYPGANGRILLERYESSTDNYDVWSANPDGTGLTNITNTPTIDERSGSWSPDGTKIAFVVGVHPNKTVWTMNADGTNRTNVTPAYPGVVTVRVEEVAWSPDGERIAFTTQGCAPNKSFGVLNTIDPDGSDPEVVICNFSPAPPGTDRGAQGDRVSWHPNGLKLAVGGPVSLGCSPDVWTVNRDGTGLTDVTQGDPLAEGHPDWAPDGSRVAYDTDANCADPIDIWVMNADGSDRTQITPGLNPVWAPDGSRIVFYSGGTVWTVKPDGTDPVSLNVTGIPTSWLAIPENAYVRPKGASPTRASLVIAYDQCTAPDRTHGAPLAAPSCSSPAKSSGYLTVGTPDANARPALNEGSLIMSVQAGTPGGPDDSDVALTFSMDDVFTDALADYTGELRVRVRLQITDKNNTPNPGAPGAATLKQVPLEMIVSCVASAATSEGSSCTSSTTVDALIPGAVPEGRRSIWQIARIDVYDGGADGDANTYAGDTLFATQGIFIP